MPFVPLTWRTHSCVDRVGINRREVVNERVIQERHHRRCRIEQSETRAEPDRGICCKKNTIAVKALFTIGAFCPNRNMAPGRRLSIGEAPRHSPSPTFANPRVCSPDSGLPEAC